MKKPKLTFKTGQTVIVSGWAVLFLLPMPCRYPNRTVAVVRGRCVVLDDGSRWTHNGTRLKDEPMDGRMLIRPETTEDRIAAYEHERRVRALEKIKGADGGTTYSRISRLPIHRLETLASWLKEEGK